MKMNFKGLVDLHTLPKTTPLLPLYEGYYKFYTKY